MTHRKILMLPSVALLMSLGALHADAAISTIASNIGDVGTSIADGSPSALGQSFTTSAGGPWDHVTFNFFSNSGSSIPEATGNLWLLTEPYLGTPAGLSTSTPGFLAESTSLFGGEHVFNSSVKLNGSTQYFAYEDAMEAPGASYLDFSGGGGQDWFSTSSAGAPYTASNALEQNFEVRGSLTSSPEPTTLGLLGLGGLALLVRRRRALARAEISVGGQLTAHGTVPLSR